MMERASSLSRGDVTRNKNDFANDKQGFALLAPEISPQKRKKVKKEKKAGKPRKLLALPVPEKKNSKKKRKKKKTQALDTTQSQQEMFQQFLEWKRKQGK